MEQVGRATPPGRDERQASRQHGSQTRMTRTEALDHSVGANGLIAGQDGGSLSLVGGGAEQAVDRRGGRHFVKGLHINIEGLSGIGKMAQHAVEEGFATIGEAVFFTPKAHDVVGIATQRR